jgi:hypothetical protein
MRAVVYKRPFEVAVEDVPELVCAWCARQSG